jgi:hypothetical protein
VPVTAHHSMFAKGPLLDIQNNTADQQYGADSMYRVRIKYFSDYKHLLRENYVEYKHAYIQTYNKHMT